VRVIILSLIILILILSIRFVQFFASYNKPRDGDDFKKEITLLDNTREGSFYQTFKVDSILIQTSKYPKYKFGYRLEISGKIEESRFDSNGKEASILVVKNPKITKLGHNNILIKSAAFIKERIAETFKKYLPQNEASLLSGILLGGSEGFTPDLRDAFEKTGVLHVVAASGMNVTLIAGFLFAASNSILSRRKAIIISILGIFYYTLLAGMSASVVRAAIMGSIVFTAAVLGRKNLAFMSLIVTGFIMLFINPLTLFDISFQLSFLSTLGILSIKPILDSAKFVKKIPFISDDLTTTISAQGGSLPILAKTFSFYSLTSIIVNGLVLWTIPILMILGGIAAICSIALPFVSIPFLYLSYPLLLYFEKTVVLFSNLPDLDFSQSNWFLWIGYYFILVAIIIRIQRKR
jgi:competence protein ComEC